MLKLSASFLTTILYPYFTLNGFPLAGRMFWLLVSLEAIFFVEMIVKNFVQGTDENG
jgi:hypothetical protein